MICSRCLLRQRAPTTLNRAFSTTSRLASSTPQTSTPNRDPPAATSTSAAQPFSTTLTPSPQTPGSDVTPLTPSHVTEKKSAPKSSVPAGTPLKGLNYFKNKTDPIAMEDYEYPPWLWDVLNQERAGTGAGKEAIDPRLYSKSATIRRAANKRARKNAATGVKAELQVPIHKQSTDLPFVSAADEAAKAEQMRVSSSARRELTQSMRNQRRGDIKERNFLKTMS